MRLRPLTPGEAALAVEVFGADLDARWVRLLTGAPTGGWAITLPGLILFPDAVEDFGAASLPMQAWFVHELTHVWQFRTRPLWTLLSWAGVAVSGGYMTRRAYRYDAAVAWDRLNLEQQAKVVEHRFLLSRGVRTAEMPTGLPPSPLPVRGSP